MGQWEMCSDSGILCRRKSCQRSCGVRNKKEVEKRMGENLLEIEHLSFSYEEGKMALFDVNVRIGAGEKIAVLGANGAGKSTFFLNINGVRQPDEGTIRFRGQSIGKKERKLLQQNVGIVFQSADDQIIASTVKSEVAFGPLNMGMEREEVEKRTTCAITQMDLEGYEMRPPHYLSGGEKKRVAIADILAMEPPIILFDEPTAALDPVSAEMLERVLGELEQEGRTILLSTHDIDFAYRFADRILVFAEGRLIADGTPEEIFRSEDILHQAKLKKPMLMEVCELLEQKKLLEAEELSQVGGHLPRSVEEFRMLLEQEA